MLLAAIPGIDVVRGSVLTGLLDIEHRRREQHAADVRLRAGLDLLAHHRRQHRPAVGRGVWRVGDVFARGIRQQLGEGPLYPVLGSDRIADDTADQLLQPPTRGQ